MTRRRRLRVALLAMLALVFQQTAFAAYVCVRTPMPAATSAMDVHCAGMPMTAPTPDPQQSAILCAYHCAHQPVMSQGAQAASVPPSLLPAILPAPPLLLAAPVARVEHVRTAVQRTPALPPPLRFRVLLI